MTLTTDIPYGNTLVLPNSPFLALIEYQTLRSENGGDKLVHGSGGIFPAAGGIKPCHL